MFCEFTADIRNVLSAMFPEKEMMDETKSRRQVRLIFNNLKFVPFFCFVIPSFLISDYFLFKSIKTLQRKNFFSKNYHLYKYQKYNYLNDKLR
jgi:hypothetical protein